MSRPIVLYVAGKLDVILMAYALMMQYFKRSLL